MNTVQDFLLRPAIKALEQAAPAVGTEFHARDFQGKLDGCSRYTLAETLHDLADAGYVRFTGRLFRWERLK